MRGLSRKENPVASHRNLKVASITVVGRCVRAYFWVRICSKCIWMGAPILNDAIDKVGRRSVRGLGEGCIQVGQYCINYRRV